MASGTGFTNSLLFIIVANMKHASTYSPVAFRSVHTGIEPPFLLKMYYAITACMTQGFDVASDVGVNFKNVGVLSIESSLFHLFHYAFLQTKHQRKGY